MNSCLSGRSKQEVSRIEPGAMVRIVVEKTLHRMAKGQKACSYSTVRRSPPRSACSAETPRSKPIPGLTDTAARKLHPSPNTHRMYQHIRRFRGLSYPTRTVISGIFTYTSRSAAHQPAVKGFKVATRRPATPHLSLSESPANPGNPLATACSIRPKRKLHG